MPILYQPQFRIHGATTFLPFASPTAAVSVAVTGLSPATNYDFQVIATNSFGTATSAVVSATTATQSGGAAPGSVAGSQNTGTANPVVAGPASGTALKAATLAITGLTVTDTGTYLATPGVGTITDPQNNTWNITAAGALQENNAPVQGGAGTSAVEYYNGQIYAQDNASKNWFTWNGSTFVAATAPPSPPPFTLTVTTTGGTVAMTVGATTLPGSGTTTITYVSTLANVKTAAASLVLTAPNTVTSVNVSVKAINPNAANHTLVVPVSVIAPTPPTAPTGLLANP